MRQQNQGIPDHFVRQVRNVFMKRVLFGLLVLLSGLSSDAALGGERPSGPSAAEEWLSIGKEFNSEGYALRQATTDKERERVVLRVEKLTQRLMELAQKNRKSPVAMEALVQAVTHELWMENKTSPARKDHENPQLRAKQTLPP